MWDEDEGRGNAGGGQEQEAAACVHPCNRSGFTQLTRSWEKRVGWVPTPDKSTSRGKNWAHFHRANTT